MIPLLLTYTLAFLVAHVLYVALREAHFTQRTLHLVRADLLLTMRASYEHEYHLRKTPLIFSLLVFSPTITHRLSWMRQSQMRYKSPTH